MFDYEITPLKQQQVHCSTILFHRRVKYFDRFANFVNLTELFFEITSKT